MEETRLRSVGRPLPSPAPISRAHNFCFHWLTQSRDSSSSSHKKKPKETIEKLVLLFVLHQAAVASATAGGKRNFDGAMAAV